MKKKRTTRVQLTKSGSVLERKGDGSMRRKTGVTKWSKVDALTDDEVRSGARSDPDAQPLTVRQLKNGYRVPESMDIKAIRLRRKMSQRAFAQRYGFSVDALQDWEQGRCRPTRTARVLLAVIDREPEAVERALR